MSKIKLYIDEDSTSRSLLVALKSRNIDVLTTSNVNRLTSPDEQQLLYAYSQNRVIYTANIKDFYHLHTLFLTEGKSHAGIILVQQQRYGIGEISRGILRLIAAKSAEEMINQIEFISTWIYQ